MALYFAFFILTDPPTSPVKYRDQVICGAIVAVVSYAVFEWVGAAYYLLAGVLAGNLWEAWRRHGVHRQHQDKRASRGGAESAEHHPEVQGTRLMGTPIEIPIRGLRASA
jgi:hypothetical protein